MGLELLHYTNNFGLRGILKEKFLRASFYQFLNDPTEFSQARNFIRKKLADEHSLRIGEVFPSHEAAFRRAKAQDEFKDCANLREVLVRMSDNLAEFTERRVMEESQPFVASFSAHAESYERMNGRLSQWRWYGSSGGYALVYDEGVLEESFRQLLGRPEYTLFWTFSNYVSYGDISLEDDEKDVLRKIVRKDLIDFEPQDVGPLTKIAMRAASFMKDPSYHEEEEYRFVVGRFRDLESMQFENGVQMPLYFYERGGAIVPFIKLFNGAASIPKRIIIGPHEAQERRATALQMYLDSAGIHNVEVSQSATPVRSVH